MPTYTNVDRIYNVLPQLREVTTVKSEHIAQYADDAEAEVNGKIAHLYTIPVVGSPVIISIATDLTMWRIMGLRIFQGETLKDSPWPDRFKEARDQLQAIADGKMTLVNTEGQVIAGNGSGDVWSSSDRYFPTTNEDNPLLWEQDRDKLEDIADEREANRRVLD